MRHEISVGIPTKRKPTLYENTKRGLAIAAQLIISAPLKLPPKIVQGAKYASLLLTFLEAIEKGKKDEEEE